MTPLESARGSLDLIAPELRQAYLARRQLQDGVEVVRQFALWGMVPATRRLLRGAREELTEHGCLAERDEVEAGRAEVDAAAVMLLDAAEKFQSAAGRLGKLESAWQQKYREAAQLDEGSSC